MRYDGKVSKGRGQKLGALTKELASPLSFSGSRQASLLCVCISAVNAKWASCVDFVNA
jgi:hypothetical protein